jgi:fumarate reductase (CoM/CoB) subunit A
LTQAIEELESLQRFIKEGKPVSTRGLCNYFEVRSMLISASAITHSALFREESRGAHFREDFPKSKQEMAKSIYVKYDGKAMRLS